MINAWDLQENTFILIVYESGVGDKNSNGKRKHQLGNLVAV